MTSHRSLKPALILTGAIAALLAAPSAHATALLWDANGTIVPQADGAGAWLGSGQWWNGTTNVDWTSGDDATFGIGGAGGAVTLASPTTVGSMTFNYFTGTYTIGSASQAITLNGGLTKTASPGILTLASPFILGAAQTWTNNSATALTTATTATVDNGGFTLTIGGTGNTSFNGSIISGAGGLTKNGTGILILGAAAPSPAHTFGGAITINGGGVLINSNGFGSSTGNITLNGGWIDQYFNNSFSRGLGAGSNEIQILGGTSGFSGQGATSSSFAITGTGSNPLVWGSTYFKPDVFLLGSSNTNTNGKGSLSNNIDLNGANRTITSAQVTDGSVTSGFTLSGVISNSSGTAGVTKTGVGNLILSAANTYNGTTSINGGTVTLSGSGTINSTGAIALNGGSLTLVNTAQVNRVTDGAAITTANTNTISYTNTSGANTYTETLGAVTLSSGQLNIVEATAQASTGSQTLTLGGLSRNGTAAVTFSATSTGPQAAGNKNMIVVTGAGTTPAGEIFGPWATTGTAAATQTDYAVFNGNYVVPANITASAESAWSTTKSSTSNFTMLNAAGAATTLTATRNVNSLRNTSVPGNVTVDASTDVVSLAGHTFNNGDVFAFGGTAPGNVTNGTVYYVRDVVAGVSFKVAASSGGAAIDLTSAGTPNVTGGIAVSSGNNLGTTGILQAMASGLAIGGSGTGVLTLPTTTADNLHLTVGSTASMTVGIPIADNAASGVLTLVKGGSGTLRLDAVNTYTGGTAINAGTLQLGTNAVANGASLNSGNYAGNIFIAGGANLSVQTNANQTFSGVISGDGNLIKAYSGTLTLSGNNTYTGKTSLFPLSTNGGGTLVVSSFNSVNGGTPLLASSSLGAPTTVANGTIDFGNGGIQTGATLKYTGSGETTDRVINFVFNGNGAAKTLDASGSGLLKFTSTFTGTGSVNNDIVLQGTGSGEIVGGLPVVFRNLNKSDAGTWTLGGAVGSTGVLTVSAGTLALQKTSSLMGGNVANWTAAKINVKSGATLALNVDSADAAGFSSTSLNTLLGNISTGVTSTSLGLVSGAKLAFDTSTATGGTFTQGNALTNSTGTSGGAIAVTKLGAGALVLDKANTYTGATSVTAGELVVTGSLSGTASVTVGNGIDAAKLSGIGTIGTATAGTVTVANNATLAPGLSAAGLTIDNGASSTLVLQTGSKLELSIANSTLGAASLNDYAKLTLASGVSTIMTGQIVTTGLSGVKSGDLFTVMLNSGGAVIGTFSNANANLIDGSTYSFTSGGQAWLINYAYTGLSTDTGVNPATFAAVTGGTNVALLAVPEPGALVSLLGGMVTLLGFQRRRRA